MASSWSANVDTKKYIRLMKALGKRALPETVAQALNQTANNVTAQSRENIKSRLIVRSKYTLNSLGSKRLDRKALNHAMGHDIDRMFSRAGSFSPYLGIQDRGGTRDAEGRRVPIPFRNARRGRDKEKRIAKDYRMDRLGDIGSQQNSAGQNRFFIGRPKGGNRPLGLYERHNGNTQLRMIRYLEEPVVDVPATHWFTDAVKRFGTQRYIEGEFIDAAREKLRRYGFER
jgi:hypothetical protein